MVILYPIWFNLFGMLILNMCECVSCCHYFLFKKINNQYYFEHDKITHHTSNKKPISSNRSRIIWVFFNEVVKLQYNFENLEANVLTFALERKFSSIIAIDEIDFENLVSSLKKKMFILSLFKRLLIITFIWSRRKLCCLLIVTKLSKKPL